MPFIVYLTCFSQVLSMAGFAAWPIYLIDLQNLWSLTNLEAGWISGAFFFGYIFATPFLVGLTDSYDSKKVYFYIIINRFNWPYFICFICKRILFSPTYVEHSRSWFCWHIYARSPNFKRKIRCKR